MQREFPEEHELLWLFESVPVQDDPEGHWSFTTLNFTVVRPPMTLTCMMTPQLGDMTVVLKQEGKPLMRLDLFDIVSTKVMQKGQHQYLEVTCEPSLNLRPLKVQVKPTLMVSWGMVLQQQSENPS